MNENNNIQQDTIYDAICNIIEEVNVDKGEVDAGKAGKYKAFLIDGVLNALKPLFAKNKLIFSIKHNIKESQYVTTSTQYGDKIKHNVIIETEIVFMHKGGDMITCNAIGEASDNGDKAFSKAQTDSYKKILCQMFLLSDGEDKDKTANNEEEIVVNVEKKTYNNTNQPTKTEPAINKYYQAILDDKFQLLKNGETIVFNIGDTAENYKANITVGKYNDIDYKQYSYKIDSLGAYVNLRDWKIKDNLGLTEEKAKQSANKFLTK